MNKKSISILLLFAIVISTFVFGFNVYATSGYNISSKINGQDSTINEQNVAGNTENQTDQDNNTNTETKPVELPDTENNDNNDNTDNDNDKTIPDDKEKNEDYGDKTVSESTNHSTNGISVNKASNIKTAVVKAPSSNIVTSKKGTATTNKVSKKSTKVQLPRTGEENTNTSLVLGTLIVLVGIGAIAYRKKVNQ